MTTGRGPAGPSQKLSLAIFISSLLWLINTAKSLQSLKSLHSHLFLKPPLLLHRPLIVEFGEPQTLSGSTLCLLFISQIAIIFSNSGSGSNHPSYLSSMSGSVAQSCLTLCDPMDGSMPGFPVQQQLLKLTQTHVH